MLCLGLAAAIPGRQADAACNTIPSAATTFRAALGSTDRPFAGPGDLVELRVRPDVCDGASPGFSASADDLVASVIFTPPSGTKNVVVLANDCTDIADCPGAASTTCIDADKAGQP